MKRDVLGFLAIILLIGLIVALALIVILAGPSEKPWIIKVQNHTYYCDTYHYADGGSLVLEGCDSYGESIITVDNPVSVIIRRKGR